MASDLQEIIQHENDEWSKIFDVELKKRKKKKFSSYWWQNYYEEMTSYINQLLNKERIKTILEAGSGSGKATLLLDKKFEKTLLDISPVALKFAKHTANEFGVKRVKYREGDIFSMPFKDNQFEFVWNIGVIEHYEVSDIKAMLREMMRVCDNSGVIAVGMPNFYSGPTIKAWILKRLKFIPGYKLDTEKFYKIDDIKDMIQEVSYDMGKKTQYFDVQYFGNPLIMETPATIIKTVGKPIARLLRRNKFLILITCKFK